MDKKIVLALVWMLFCKTSITQPPSGYYNGAYGKTCSTLKNTLNTIINAGNNPQSYSNLWTQYQVSDLKPRTVGTGSANVIFDIYSWKPNQADPYQYTPGSGQCGSYGAEADCYNREHSVPLSWFNGNTGSNGPATDYLHIFPSDGYVNGKRANFIYGEVATANYTSLAGNKLGTSAIAGFTGQVFEPVDSVKGDLARAFLYFVTMYQADMQTFAGNADATQSFDASTFPSVKINYLKLMLKWHINDPVSQKEKLRNNAAYTFQGNRNPFIDSAQYASLVWNSSCPGLGALPVELLFFEGKLNGNTVNLKWDVAAEQNALQYEVERSTNGIDFMNIGALTAKGKSTYTFNDEVENFNGKKLWYRIKKLDNNGNFIYSDILTIQIPFNIKFVIYPNPVQNFLIAQLNNSDNNLVDYAITDFTGRQLLYGKQYVLGSKFSIAVNNLQTGTYLLKLTVNQKTYVEKFVVAK